MKLDKFFDGNYEELFIGAMLQFPLYFILGWWVLPVMVICGIFWRIGGMEGGSKLFRRILIPALVCGSAALGVNDLGVLLAIPFMVWFAPSYGGSSTLFKFFMQVSNNRKKADLLTRCTTYFFYWASFMAALLL